MQRLVPQVSALARRAAALGIQLTIDAEEADRLDLSLDVIEALAADPATRHWPGLGLAVQAYGKRALDVIDWVAATARTHGRRMTVRLVKGAYWDSEIKRAQERGLDGYPVYTRKITTDVSYLACAGRLFSHTDVIYPQFATHNAHSIAVDPGVGAGRRGLRVPATARHGPAAVCRGGTADREFPAGSRLRARGRAQGLAGLSGAAAAGERRQHLLRESLHGRTGAGGRDRARSDRGARAPRDLCAPAPAAAGRAVLRPAQFARPRPGQSAGTRGAAQGDCRRRAAQPVAGPHHQREPAAGQHACGHQSRRPARQVGSTRDATAAEIAQAFDAGAAAQPAWDLRGGDARALPRQGGRSARGRHAPIFIELLVREAGKTISDAIAEVREAVDFCRYYALRGAAAVRADQRLDGPTGEFNELSLHGRGVFACISPWNFPLAIFAGQVTAALAAGNAVVAKPAEPTPLIAARFVRLLHEAGVPPHALHLVPAPGRMFGEIAFAHAALAGVAMTGSTATALTINRSLAARGGAIVPLIAETGGMNAMIVDSTALPEQVVDDVVSSAFMSAGQRCSALRLLFLQDEIADQVLEMIAGAMDELVIGDPADLKPMWAR